MLKLFREWRARRNEAYAKKVASAPLNRTVGQSDKLVGKCFAKPLSILNSQELVDSGSMTSEEYEGLREAIRNAKGLAGPR